MSVSRRGLLWGAMAGTLSGWASRAAAVARRQSPTPGPVAVASGNGLRGVELARRLMLEGADPLDAAVEGVKIQELDPEDQSVGLGGLPNEECVVQLDASCMHGPTRRAGAVAAIEDIATPSEVARAVLQRTDHIMIVGPGAKQFAKRMGFAEQNLLTEESREAWLRWRSRLNPRDNWLEPESDAETDETTGTINLCALDGNGQLGSVTTTSGLSWKLSGRAGDSPIIGAGQYCDNEVGAAGSTGRGEANIMVCGAFLAVEEMRRGRHPEDACLEVLRRVVAMTEDRLLDEQTGRPLFGLNFYAVRKDGAWGGASLYEPSAKERERRDEAGKFAVADGDGARLVDMAYLYTAAERPERSG